MIIQEPFPGLKLIQMTKFVDSRGYFCESWNRNVYREYGIDCDFVQDNESMSHRGTLRGLHYQMPPYGQAKLVRVVKGKVFDVAVDIRHDSPTFGQWYGVELSADNCLSLFIPEGFAHGFLALEDQTIFQYKCSQIYFKAAERSIDLFDKSLAISWPSMDDSTYLISEKDRAGTPLSNIEPYFITPC